MTVLKLFFSLHGRINRATWWLLSLTIGIVNAILAKLLAQVYPPVPFGPLGYPVGIADMLATVITFYPVLAIGSKRLHDRNKSGWWLALYAAPAALLIVFAVAMIAAPHMAADLVSATMFLFFATLIMIGWNFIELGFLKGDANANDFGHPWKMSDLLDGKDETATGPTGPAGDWAGSALADAPKDAAAARTSAAVGVASPMKVRVSKPQGFGRRHAPAR